MRKIVLYGIIIFEILLIASLVRGIQLSRLSSVRIAKLEEEKVKLESEHERLKNEGEYVKSEYYLEKVARDELHLSKPGETVVIVPDGLRIGESANLQTREEVEKENWQKWLAVLSGKIWVMESGQDGNASVLKTDVRKD